MKREDAKTLEEYVAAEVPKRPPRIPPRKEGPVIIRSGTRVGPGRSSRGD